MNRKFCGKRGEVNLLLSSFNENFHFQRGKKSNHCQSRSKLVWNSRKLTTFETIINGKMCLYSNIFYLIWCQKILTQEMSILFAWSLKFTRISSNWVHEEHFPSEDNKSEFCVQIESLFFISMCLCKEADWGDDQD